MENRFYPEIFPPFANEPTRDKFKLISSPKTGEGIIALVPFKQGEVVFAFTGALITEQTLFTLQYLPGQYVHDPIVMGKVLHSCEPNMVCDMGTRTYSAARDIEPGEYVTMDYETTEDVLFRPFICCCGAPGRRGLVRGRRFRMQDEKAPELVVVNQRRKA